MDLFEALPDLRDQDHPRLRGRALRLISAAGLVYDGNSLYFELNAPRNWGRRSGGGAVIGVSTPLIQPDGGPSPHRAIVDHVRKKWRFSVDLHPPGFTCLVDEQRDVHVLPNAVANAPYLIVLTSPLLGGGDIPDGLAQIAYLLSVRRARAAPASSSLLRIEKRALATFLGTETWRLSELLDQSWAELSSHQELPPDADLRPVLAVRALQHVVAMDAQSSLLPLAAPSNNLEAN
jgi:hypothetical protein